MEKLKEILVGERYERIIAALEMTSKVISEGKYNSLIIPLETKEYLEPMQFISHDDFPSVDIEVESKQITAETIGYFPTGVYNFKSIKLFNEISKDEKFDKALLISKQHIFELTDVLISKTLKTLTFTSAHIL